MVSCHGDSSGEYAVLAAGRRSVPLDRSGFRPVAFPADNLGGPALLSAHEDLFLTTHNESEDVETEAGDSAVTAAPVVAVARARKIWPASPPPSSNASLLLSKTGALTHPCQFISARPVSAFARLNGAGIRMRC
jgi:hypothetical protein